MREYSKISLFSVLALALIFLAFSCNPGTGKDGFTDLFNGENWEAWSLKIRSGDQAMAQRLYAIENGMVHIFDDSFPDTIKLNTGENDTHGLFYTTKSYSKYILKFEYKWGTKIANNFGDYQYDAGCYYHVIDDKIWPTGIEYQIRFDHTKNLNHTGDFWASGVTFQWYAGKDSLTFLHPDQGGKPQAIRSGEHLATPSSNYHALDNQWNQCEVIVMGNEYAIHKLNGDVVNMAADLSVGQGIIGFQSETAEIWYRNIQIKVVEEIIPMDEFL